MSNVPDEISATATIGTDDRIDPKIGIRLIVAAMPPSSSGYFTLNSQQPDVGEDPVDEADDELPADHARQPAIDADVDAIVVALVALGHQRAQEALDALEIDEDERRHHQHQKQAADPEHDAADELLAVLKHAPALALGRLQPRGEPLLDRTLPFSGAAWIDDLGAGGAIRNLPPSSGRTSMLTASRLMR